MLSDSELLQLFEIFETPELGQRRIQWIRQNAPVRPVSGGSRAVKVRYVPRKMPFVLEAEAFQTEYVALVTYDNDDETLEIYLQPTKLKISYVHLKGKKVTINITPDIFLIQKSGFIFIECKTEEELKRLADASPNRYVVDEKGCWRSPPAETAAAELGCQFKIRSTTENNWKLVENLEFLRDYFEDGCPEVSEDDRQRVLSQFETNAWSTMFDLIHTEPAIEADWIYSLIVRREIYFDLINDRIADYTHALVFRDELASHAYRLFARSKTGLAGNFNCNLQIAVGMRFTWDGRGWLIANVGETRIAAQPLENVEGDLPVIELTYDQLFELAQAGKIGVVATPDSDRDVEQEGHRLVRGASPAQIEIAKYRYQVIFGEHSPKNPYVSVSKRTRNYWMANYRAAEQQYGYGFIGLIPDRDKTQGNRSRKLDSAILTILSEVITNDWETAKKKNFTASYGKLRNQCEEKGFIPPSLKVFRSEISKRHSYEQEKKRVGEKAAYNLEPQYLELEYTTPRHGTRPFHIGHIDHTPIPLKVRDKTLQKVLKSIWLTVMLDAYSRKVLAYYFSFDPPSYRSCLMVIRDCVRRHGRLPKFIVVDQGSDFNSVYFETTLAMLRCSKKERPGGKPRFGSIMERVFNTTMTQLIDNLFGSTQIYVDHYRQVSKDVDPERLAIWTYERITIRFEQYLNDVYHKNEHSTLGMSPEQAFVVGMRESGKREHRLISYSHDFKVLTCPSTDKGDAKVTPRGVKINYLYYKCAAFHLPGIPGTRVPIRFEPFNVGIAFAFVNGFWHECQSEHYAIFQNYTERSVLLASQRLLLLNRRQGKAAEINAERLATFLASVEGEELLEMQRLNDQESQDHRAAINKVTRPPASHQATPASPPVNRIIPELLEDF